MATRYYFDTTTTPPVSPTFDASWNQTGQAIRGKLVRKTLVSTVQTLTDSAAITVPVTTTQNILCVQFVSDPIPQQRLIGLVNGLVIRALQNVSTANCTLAFTSKLFSNDGATNRGVIFQNFGVDTAFSTGAATRIQTAFNGTPYSAQQGDRIVLEIGANAAAPTTMGTFTMRFGDSAASDFALTSGLSTDLNSWFEINQNVRASDLNNYKFISVGDGMSTSEKLR